MPLITFLIPVRKREMDIRRLACYFVKQALEVDCEVIIIYEDNGISMESFDLLKACGVSLARVPGHSSVFHKTRLLNVGLIAAKGNFIIAYDSDLLPLFPIEILCQLVESSPRLVLGGYRIMSGEMDNGDLGEKQLVLPASAPEDCSGALYKQIARGERFMVCPVFQRDQLIQLGGWDEFYRGWGCEDQDILERYLKQTQLLPARLPNLLYLHFDHALREGWNEAALIEKNRDYYYKNK